MSREGQGYRRGLEAALRCVENDCCAGESAFASGVNAACERHREGIKLLLKGADRMGARRFDWFFERHVGVGVRWQRCSFPLAISISIPFLTVTVGIGRRLA